MWRSGVSGIRTPTPTYIMHLSLPTELSSRRLNNPSSNVTKICSMIIFFLKKKQLGNKDGDRRRHAYY